MTRTMIVLFTLISMGTAASSAYAHHSHPYFYDQCRTVTIEGQVERVEWKNPHSLIVLRVDEATVYTIDWNALSALTRTHVIDSAQAALVPGARVVVTGNPIRDTAQVRQHFPDLQGEVNPRTVDPRTIRGMADSWSWAAPADSIAPNCPGK